jgi:ATP-dependent DNA ligase
MIKVKHERTADCVVAGFRWHKSGGVVGSLLLGLYDDAGDLHHVGVIGAFPMAQRKALVDELAPLRAERVVEVNYEQVQSGRFRHQARFRRWRPDRDPRSCTYDQLETPTPELLANVFGS